MKPFVTRNAELLGMLAPQFEKELKEADVDENLLDRVRIAIQEKLTGKRPTIEDIADALHMSPRTLQRRLQDEGSSFQRVLEDARHHLARSYLTNPILELNEAAYLLGYEDANSFVRAFRTWEGVPPARWREQHFKDSLMTATRPQIICHMAASMLREKGISFVVAGASSVDLVKAVELLATHFGIRTLLLEGGGHINGAFLQAGLVDEVSLLLLPGIDGRHEIPALFDGVTDSNRKAVPLTLKSVEQREAGALWVRYDVPRS